MDFRYSQPATVVGGAFGFGGARTWGDPRRSLNMALTNAFEIKTEVDGEERRSTFATLNVSSGYDFEGVDKKWQPLRTTASIKPDRRADVRLSMTHELYGDDGRFSLLRPTLQGLTVTSSFRFQGRGEEDRLDPYSGLGTGGYSPGFGFERDLHSDVEDATQPWRLNLQHYYDLQKRFGPTTKRSWVKVSCGLNPTRNWRLDYSINYDLMARDVTAQNLSIYRDLHCWEARFSYYPTGYASGFYFKINIKQIPQIRFEHGRGRYGL